MVLLNPLPLKSVSLNIVILTFHYGAIEPLYDATYRVKQLQLTFHYGAIEPLELIIIFAIGFY